MRLEVVAHHCAAMFLIKLTCQRVGTSVRVAASGLVSEHTATPTVPRASQASLLSYLPLP